MILLDTHIVLWIAQVPDHISDAALEAIKEARTRGELAISDKTLWEMAMMISRDQVGVRTSMQDFLREVERRFKVLPITAGIAERSTQFSKKYPKDSADRIIGATAIVHGMKLVTADKLIRKSGEVPTIW